MRTAHETSLSTWGDIPTLRLPGQGQLGSRYLGEAQVSFGLPSTSSRALLEGQGRGGERWDGRYADQAPDEALCQPRPGRPGGRQRGASSYSRGRSDAGRGFAANWSGIRPSGNGQGCSRSSTMEGLRRHAFEGCVTRVRLRFRQGGRAKRRERARRGKRSTRNQNVGMRKG